ncbi:MAG: hypothetical protein ACLFQX_07505 [Candidatus Kapaibacterium sp.]
MVRLKTLIFLSIILLASSASLFARPSVLFIQPEGDTYVISRVFNKFQDLYPGVVKWVAYDKYTKEIGAKYGALVLAEEQRYTSGAVSTNFEIYYGGAKMMWAGGGRINTSLPWDSVYDLQALEIVKDLIEEFDPEYFEELKEIFCED